MGRLLDRSTLRFSFHASQRVSICRSIRAERRCSSMEAVCWCWLTARSSIRYGGYLAKVVISDGCNFPAQLTSIECTCWWGWWREWRVAILGGTVGRRRVTSSFVPRERAEVRVLPQCGQNRAE